MEAVKKRKQIIDIYIKNPKIRLETAASTNNRQIIDSAAHLPLGKIISLTKKIQMETNVKQIKLKRIKQEQLLLINRIQNLAKEISNKQNKRNQTQHSFHTRGRCDTAQKLPQARLLISSKSNNSLYDRERVKHFEELRNQNSIIKEKVNQKKVGYLKQKKSIVSRVNYEKEKQKYNKEIYQSLKKLKYEKEKQSQCLKYSALNLQTFYKNKQLQRQEEQELSRLQQLRKIENEIMSKINPKR